jgi:hypothetical protein
VGITFFVNDTAAQCYGKGGIKLGCANTVVSAVPFLRITPDARSGAMGDVGIAVSADPNTMHFNTSKLVYSEQNSGVSATYTPWLRALGLNDMYLAYLSTYKKINSRQAFGLSARYFSLGEINFTDENGTPTGTGSPTELELNLGFAQKLTERLAVGINAKYVYSNLAAGTSVNGQVAKVGNGFGADLSLTYRKPIRVNGRKNNITAGLALTNIGTKISYTNSANRDYMPANLGLGLAYEINLNEYNSITLAADINKLMVPTPQPAKILDDKKNEITNPEYDAGGVIGVPDYKEQSPVGSIFSSFSDAPDGFKEEIKEFTWGLGFEYWYDKQFAARIGYFNEDKLKGGRKYLTLGFGLKYNIFGLNFSYLVPTTSNRNPLDNTLRFSLLFDFGAGGLSDDE